MSTTTTTNSKPNTSSITKIYKPTDSSKIGYVIGKKFSNIITIVNEANTKFKSKPYIKFDKKNKNFEIKANSQEVIDFVESRLKANETTDKFKYVLNVNNLPEGCNKNDFTALVVEYVEKQHFNVWLHESGKFGKLFLRNETDYELLLNTDLEFNENKLKITKLKEKFVKYDKSLFLKFNKSIPKEEVETIFRVVIGLIDFKVWLGENGLFGKLFASESDIQVVMDGRDEGKDYYEIEDIRMSVFKNKPNPNPKSRERFEHSVNVNNFPPTLQNEQFNELILNFVTKEDFRNWIHESGKFGKVFLRNADDVRLLIEKLDGCFYDDVKLNAYNPSESQPNRSERTPMKHAGFGEKYENCVNIRNINEDLNTAEVTQIISEYIENFRVSLPKDDRGGHENRGFGRVFVKDYESAEYLVQCVHRRGFNGMIWEAIIRV